MRALYGVEYASLDDRDCWTFSVMFRVFFGPHSRGPFRWDTLPGTFFWGPAGWSGVPRSQRLCTFVAVWAVCVAPGCPERARRLTTPRTVAILCA